MAKRTATSDLNRDNWDEKMTWEAPGEFKKGDPEELKTRVIKTVKRRLPETASTPGESEAPTIKSAFSSFAGFGKNTATFTTVGSTSSPFSFLSKITSTTSTSEPPKEDSTSSMSKDDFKFEKSTTYYEKLKELNIAVTKWIKQHVDQNPVCILSPIFKDYEKYLLEINGNGNNGANNETSNAMSATPQNPALKNFTGFSFGKSNSSAADSSVSKDETETAPKSTFSFAGFGQMKKAEATSTPGNLFNVKQSVADTTKPGSSMTNIFSSKGPPFTFGSNVAANNPESTTAGDKKDEEEEDEDEPPKVEFKPVVEEDSIYSKKCKVFFKNGKDYKDRGVGTLHLKPVKDKDKTQLIVRADTSLGNIILNVLLMEGLVVNRVGKNNVMIVGVPTSDDEQKASTVLVRVKNADEADELLKTLKEHIK